MLEKEGLDQPKKETFTVCLLELIQKAWKIRLLRFLVVGVINTLFSYIIYAILILLRVHYSWALLISTVLGIIFNFFTTGRIVFNNKDNKLILRFFVVYGFTYFVNLLGLRGFEILEVDMLLAGAIMTLPVALLSYVLNRKFVFPKDPLPPISK